MFVLATENQNKVREFLALFKGRIELRSLKDAGFQDSLPPEGDQSYEENARVKAETVGRALNCWAIGDDSGFEVEALQNEPGIRSARYGSQNGIELSAGEKRTLILRKMKIQANRKARFVSVLAIYNPQKKSCLEFRGEVQGLVSEEERGENGFGYDSIFIPDGFSKTFAELSDAEKNIISHRARAATLFLQSLDKT